jgi:hypothetical protein
MKQRVVDDLAKRAAGVHRCLHFDKSKQQQYDDHHRRSEGVTSMVAEAKERAEGFTYI